jgi:glycerol-3-phosphate dehydrogenase
VRAPPRDALLEQLDGGFVDLLVVGGGIVGSRIAYEAARAGMAVALIDAGDFGGATSSSSSKLVHGGLRYLAAGEFRLVRRLHGERRVLMTHIAPHLVRPQPLLLVVEREHARRSVNLLAALTLYGALAASHRSLPELMRPRHARLLVPALDDSAIALCGLVSEAQTHDARLTLATVRAAAAAGAATLNYARLEAWESKRGRVTGAVLRDVHGGNEVRLRFRAAINAAGPWVDWVRQLADERAPRLARLSRGIHVVLPLDCTWHAGIALFEESRSAVAVPWQGMLLVGTTDTEVDEPDSALPDDSEIEAVLSPLARILRDGSLDRGRVVHSFAGVRVLPRDDGDVARASREHLLESAASGLISVAGGKLTTHRTIAVDALRRLPAELRPRRLTPSADALPGAGYGKPLPGNLDPDIVAHLISLYGADASRVAAYAAIAPETLERVHARGPDILAQVLFARDHEFALTVDDIALRRTTLAVRGLADEHTRSRLEHTLLESGRRSLASSVSAPV